MIDVVHLFITCEKQLQKVVLVNSTIFIMKPPIPLLPPPPLRNVASDFTEESTEPV